MFWRAIRGDLISYIKAACLRAVRRLGDNAYVSIAAFILQSNGRTPGNQPLTRRSASPSTRRPRDKSISRPARLRRADAAGAARPPPRNRGFTVEGEVKNYMPVTDEMLRNPDPATGS